ncbi:hypothetical protein [Clostridium botulinum]|uniref:hypothetical protein n=1 Tax=Clostridium botulinum TaxID=1491 RepID=UPI0004ACFB3B|nr:hypothetical protein [Clostridium botulinum]APH20917.1 hypothetical protein NPD1_4135 [Clostridium botulinum]APQ71295.1 hypothetical protein RSJ8_4092 [Clostridium botulinum]MBN3359199.1 hypothetical protein [Clostridium botulinum]MBN3379056.1 hypothetical protein [Clostridium botulinum]QDY27039.1 hypothetical protein CGQ40_20255 [Clostridium botulinum]
MSWMYGIQKITDYHKVICDNESKEIITIVDEIDKEIISNIITKHNRCVNEEFNKGLEYAIKIAKNIK